VLASRTKPIQRSNELAKTVDCTTPAAIARCTIRDTGSEHFTPVVLLNLLSNAIKYNRADGAVIVDCVLTDSQRVRISVQDTGIGLGPDQLESLFLPFNRLGQEGGSEEGTRIGLVVTKKLTEMMGGTIGVSSSPGTGSVFWIELKSSERARNNSRDVFARLAHQHPCRARKSRSLRSACIRG
jgi:signal transduction histidine kinase